MKRSVQIGIGTSESSASRAGGRAGQMLCRLSPPKTEPLAGSTVHWQRLHGVAHNHRRRAQLVSHSGRLLPAAAGALSSSLGALTSSRLPYWLKASSMAVRVTAGSRLPSARWRVGAGCSSGDTNS